MATKSKKPITPLVTFDADREEKRKALKTAMKQIEKDFGEGRMYRCLMGVDELKEVYSHE